MWEGTQTIRARDVYYTHGRSSCQADCSAPDHGAWILSEEEPGVSFLLPPLLVAFLTLGLAVLGAL